MNEIEIEFGASFIICGKPFRLETYVITEGSGGQQLNLTLFDETTFKERIEMNASTKAQRDYFIKLPELMGKTQRLHDHFLKEIDEEERYQQ